VQILSHWAHGSKDKRPILVGIGNGALLPFLFAGTKSGSTTRNLSVGFSVQLPDNVRVCAPLTSTTVQGHRELTSSPPLQGKWLAAWADQPDSRTAVFVRKMTGAATIIEPYDTPLDTVAANEVHTMLAADNQSQTLQMPVVEVPAKNPNDTVTLFYSGDGGWRDLDRDLAGYMAEQGYPVVGIDTLRAFWSSKTPETATAELAELMAYYRAHWKAKNFALAGYSFGADILPALYNRLPQTDREGIGVIVLLALGKTADFEIHVSGWIGQNNDGLPILPELNQIEAHKILCVYGKEEKDESACQALATSGAKLLELPGGHHFDQDYSTLAARIIDVYRQSGLKGSN
jgi:type IV secretory pathway VirJ component